MKWNETITQCKFLITGLLRTGRLRRYKKQWWKWLFRLYLMLVGLSQRLFVNFLRIRSAFRVTSDWCGFFTWPSGTFLDFYTQSEPIQTITINNTSKTTLEKTKISENEKAASDFNGVFMNTFGNFVSHFTVSIFPLNV